MNREEKIRARVVRDRSSLLEREELISGPRQHDMNAALAKTCRQKLGHIEDEILLAQPGRSGCTLIVPTMSRVEHDRVESILGSARPGRGRGMSRPRRKQTRTDDECGESSRSNE